MWYWRQVLSIVFAGILQEARQNKWNFLVGLFQTWCIWGGLQITAGIVLLKLFALHHPEQLQTRININIYGLPMLAFRSNMNSLYEEQVEILLLSLLLNTLVLLLTGICCSRSARANPRSLLLVFIASYIVVNFGTTMAILVEVAQHQPNAAGFLLLRALIVLPLAPALILFGGMRGLSPLSPNFKR
jgi:hypothetical protein